MKIITELNIKNLDLSSVAIRVAKTLNLCGFLQAIFSQKAQLEILGTLNCHDTEFSNANVGIFRAFSNLCKLGF